MRRSHAGMRIPGPNKSDGSRLGLVVATALVSLTALGAAPGQAAETATASASYNPWTAAALTCSALPIEAAAVGPGLFIYPHQPGASIIGTPFLGLGHAYVGESSRGYAFMGAGALAYVVSAAAYVWLWGGRSFLPTAEPRWQAGAGDVVGLGYYTVSTALTAWAAWDAFRIAEEKNRATAIQTP